MKLLSISTLFLLLSSCMSLEKSVHHKMLAPTEYQKALEVATQFNLIDVRTKKEHENGRIKGAINMSYFSFKFRKLLNEQNLNTELPTYIYCQTAHRSPFVARILIKNGFTNVIDLEKGMANWEKRKLPVER